MHRRVGATLPRIRRRMFGARELCHFAAIRKVRIRRYRCVCVYVMWEPTRFARQKNSWNY